MSMESCPLIHQVAVRGDGNSDKMVAFTFDDGPDPLYTPQILDIFREAGGKATFFMVGSQIVAHPEVARQVYEEGHEIANHTYTHPRLTEKNMEEQLQELVSTEQAIVHITGNKPRVFRPPYFDYNDEVAKVCLEMGYPAIGAANMQANDWAMPGIDHIVTQSRVFHHIGPMLLFHDGFGDRSQTVEAVRQLVAEYIEHGYQIVTVSDLLSAS